MLADIVSAIVASQTDFELVGDAVGTAGLALAASQAAADILIRGGRLQRREALRLLWRSPRMKIVTIDPDGHSGALYELRLDRSVLDEISPIARIPDTAAMASPALTLDLERRLRAKVPLTPRKADRRHTLNLTGSMAGYVWSINNVPWTKDTPPLPLAKGERVELLFVNQTPMPHPMHLHGHEFQVVEINDQQFSGVVRDTVLVPPGHRVVVAFDANNPGLWALHCHLLYHLDAGMFTTLRYV